MLPQQVGYILVSLFMRDDERRPTTSPCIHFCTVSQKQFDHFQLPVLCRSVERRKVIRLPSAHICSTSQERLCYCHMSTRHDCHFPLTLHSTPSESRNRANVAPSFSVGGNVNLTPFAITSI